MKNKKKYVLSKGIKNDCFFLIPSIVMTPSNQSTWDSEKKSVIFGFLKLYVQLDIITINKDIDTSINQDVMNKINQILYANNYYVKDVEGLKNYLKATQNVVLLVKNSPQDHKYFKQTLFNIIKFMPFVAERDKNHVKKIQ